jgi:hypothetical protein
MNDIRVLARASVRLSSPVPGDLDQKALSHPIGMAGTSLAKTASVIQSKRTPLLAYPVVTHSH